MSRAIVVGILVLTGLLLGACRGDEPYAGGYGGESCLPGAYRDPGPGCTSAPVALVVDGLDDEWQDERLQYEHPGSCCNSGDPAGVLVGRDGQGGVGFFLRTIGAPITDASVAYAVYLRRPDMTVGETGNSYVVVWVTPTGAELYLNSQRVYGIPLETAFGPNGIELRVPAGAFPFPGAAIFVGLLYTASGAQWVAQREPPFASKFCWDPLRTDGECSFF